ncbi:MAG: TonB-dependent receptor [Sulfurimonas sp.]|nr:TonB-dependent receptor [Sulfurimonas sp.]MDD3835687.1 TonB-dependent receptor [Sulfurimonas sp.]
MRKITISASLALLMSNYAFASEDMKAIEVVSIATKTQKSIDGVAASVDVITQEEIEKMGASSLGEILSKTSGLVMQYGTFPSASSKSKSSISIRGMGANGTLFLLDGRRLAGEVKNPYDLERIPASIIQRIEIVKGPMSSLYGADAVGGVINIITKRPTDEMKISYDARFGMNEDSDAQTTNLALSIQGKNSGFGYSAYSSFITTKPYEQRELADSYAKTPSTNVKPSQHPNPAVRNVKNYYAVDTTFREDSEIYTLGTRLTYDFTNDLTMGIDVNYFKEERDGVYIGFAHPAKTAPNPTPIFNTPVNSHDENNRLDLSVDAEYAPTDALNIKARIYNSKYEKRNTTTAKYWFDLSYPSENASANAAMNADVDITVYEASASYLATDAHLLTGGVEYRDEKRKSSVFTNNIGMTEKKVHYKSIYLQDEWEVSEEFNTIFGARYEEISNAEDKPTFRVGGIYEFDKLAKLRANFAQGFRAADIRELYVNMNTPNGPQRGAEVLGYNLKPESTDAYEIGLGGRDKKFSYDLVIFYNKITNKIQQIRNKSGIYTYENVSDANTKGLELSFSYLLLENLNSQFAYNELKTEDEKTKKDLEFNPDRTFMLSFDYQATKDLNLGLIGRYIGEQHYTKVINEGSPSQMSIPNSKTDAYNLVDITFGYKIDKRLELYGGVNNLGDSGVEDELGSNVGRYYFAGIRGSF